MGVLVLDVATGLIDDPADRFSSRLAILPRIAASCRSRRPHPSCGALNIASILRRLWMLISNTDFRWSWTVWRDGLRGWAFRHRGLNPDTARLPAATG
jgi:hypothetical protein